MSDTTRDEWIGATLPGDLLLLTQDAGGDRWTLAGRPIPAGAGLDVLLEGTPRCCPRCRGEGRVEEEEPLADGYPPPCGDCGGRGYLYRPSWVRAFWEYRNDRGGPGSKGWLYLPLVGLRPSPPHGIEIRPGDRVRCRWRR